MPTLATTNFNIVLGVLGGWVSLYGSVSYLLKESFYVSGAPISLLAGVALSPPAVNFIRPLDYALGSPDNLAAVTLGLSRLALGVQLVLAGAQLPGRYLAKQWRQLALLAGPAAAAAWLVTSLLVWALIVPEGGRRGRLPLPHALAVGACLAPATDPVLLATAVARGRFADRNLPRDLQDLVVAESGATTGVGGYLCLFLVLYLVKFNGDGGGDGDVRAMMGLWFGETWGYTVLLGIAYGAAVGCVARGLLRWAGERRFVDSESFLVPAVALALFVVGTCGMFGSGDVLACFAAGSALAWGDGGRFRLEVLDDSLQPTVNLLLHVPVFMWYGAVCPWDLFRTSSAASLGRLVALGVSVLLLRRLPWVLAFYRFIPQVEGSWQAIFVGFFGPVGVSAVYYLYVTLAFLRTLGIDGRPRADVEALPETVTVVVWFVVICSVFVHGFSIPLGKLSYYLPETNTRGALSSSSPSGYPGPSFAFDDAGDELGTGFRRSVFRIDGSAIRKLHESSARAALNREALHHQ
ncbi:Cation/H+ exchanger [Corynascus novoguineensis]|uniref:Cation/H+ exchanger n=1 Tax=Corynascus novoguineensis TaxID=1126955 RepID=A0AAN7D141_9PEZI|nr:Cation/H+ exchanger [Corynascus novoguineensis]